MTGEALNTTLDDNATQEQGSNREPRLRLLALGYEPIPVAGKAAVASGWTDGTLTPERVEAETLAHPTATNTGLRCGRLVGVDIDLTDPVEVEAAVALVEATLGETPFKRVGRKGMMLLYSNPRPIPKLTVASSDGAKIELLGQGQQLVAYGVHPDTGQPYRWVGGAEPLDGLFDPPATAPDLLNHLARHLAELLAKSHPDVKVSWGREASTAPQSNRPYDEPADVARGALFIQAQPGVAHGSRDDEATRIIGKLMSFHLSRQLAEPWVQTWGERCTPPLDSDQIAANGAWKHEGEDRDPLDTSSIDDNFGEVVKALAAPTPAGEAFRIFDPWAQVHAPTFPLDTLPEALRQFAADQAVKIGADPSAVAMAALAVCSGAIDHRVTLNLLRRGEWMVSPRLWVMLCGAPSTKKTPVMNACVGPLYEAQKALASDYKRKLAMWEMLKAAGATDPAPEPYTRLVVNDVTIEKLGDILSHQDRGVFCARDELAGWIGQMEKYGGGRAGAADRALWLESWNGGPRSIDRMSRSTFVENLSVSILGGIQPARLAELSNLSSDGLLQRFLPVMMQPAGMGQDLADQPSALRYAGVIERLTKLGPGRPMILSDDALAVKGGLETLLHELSRMDGLGEAFANMAGKLMNAFGALAIILHLAADADEATALAPISGPTAKAAERIVREFILPHARAFYDLDTGAIETTRALASYVLTQDRERFVISDFTTGVRAVRGLPAVEVVDKVSFLVAGGWLFEDGYPVRAWTVVPGLREHLAVRRAEEIERKRLVVEKLAALRKEVANA